MVRFFPMLLLGSLAIAALPHAQTPSPILKTRVDLVLVEAVVLDDAGRPVTALQPGDVDVRVDGVARPVRWLQPIVVPTTDSTPVRRSEAADAPVRPPDPAESVAPLMSRWVVVVVDRGSIAFGAGQTQLDAAATVIERLPAGDRVAIWLMPSAARGLQFATPRDVLARAVRSATGLQSPRNSPFGFLPGEALAVLDGVPRMEDDVVRRECFERGLVNRIPNCVDEAKRELRTLGLEDRDRLRLSLDSLEAVAAAIAPLDGPKDLVLVTGQVAAGMEETKRLAAIERIANASRISIHGLLTASTLSQLVDASSATSTTPTSLSFAVHESVPAVLAGATGGQAWSGNPRVGAQRLLGEMAGTWILAIEAADGDRDDREHRLEVKAVRRGIRVARARRGFRIEPPTATPVASPTSSAAVGEPTEPTEPIEPPETTEPTETMRPLEPGDIPDDAVLEAMRKYVVAFETALSAVVIEERYVQIVKPWRGVPRADRPDPALDFDAGPRVSRAGFGPILATRRLRADVLLVQSTEAMWTGYRDVFEVDGHAVRDRSDRLRKLFFDGGVAREPELRRVADESARYNLGSLSRNVNLPTFPLFYLHPRNVRRLTFSTKGTVSLDGVPCRLVEFREKARPTIVVQRDGVNVPIRGQAWVDPVSGAVRRAVLRFENSAERISFLDVRYRRADGMAVLVPDRLWEWYQGAGHFGVPEYYRQFTEGLATYAHLRRFTVETSETVR